MATSPRLSIAMTLPGRTNPPATDSSEVRERILSCASDLFYRQGVRAVGVDLVVAKAGVAKTSLYRHFRTKDDLIVAFLEREDDDFWATWDGVATRHAGDPEGELLAHMQWIGERLSRSNYRGCPQINVSAEFPEREHPARQVTQAHMRKLRARLEILAGQLHVARPEALASQLALLVNGAFVSSDMFADEDATPLLSATANAMVKAARDMT